MTKTVTRFGKSTPGSVDEVKQLINMDPELRRRFHQKSGQIMHQAPTLVFFGLNKMPEIYNKAAKIGIFNDWLAYKLTGVLTVELSNGSTTGIKEPGGARLGSRDCWRVRSSRRPVWPGYRV